MAWEASPGGGHAYTSEVEYADGSRINFGCRERPHLIFDGDDAIIGLLNGAAPVHCHVAGSDDHAFTLLQLMKTSSSTEPATDAALQEREGKQTDTVRSPL